MKFLLSLISIGVFTTVGLGQAVSSVCSESSVKKISSRGIKIGAKMDDVLGLFATAEQTTEVIRRVGASSGWSNKDIGVEIVSVNPNVPGKEKPGFEGISSYTFYFVDERVTGFSTSYSKPTWPDPKQFTEKISEIFDLPAAAQWTGDSNSRSIKCSEYDLRTNVYQWGSSFSIYDTRLETITKERRARKEKEQFEADLKVFKP